MKNPFDYGNPVSPERFVIPNDDLYNCIKERITNRDNTAVISEPRFGKTSLLLYIKSTLVANEINKQSTWRYYFQYIDAQMFNNNTLTREQFWEYALQAVKKIAEAYPVHDVAKQYRRCEVGKFSIFNLEKMFEQLAKCHLRLALMIDEFDDLLSHPELGGEVFFGQLRALSSLQESLVLVIASRLDINELHRQKQFQHSGSPYFNHFGQFFLGPFTDASTQSLLSRGSRFSESDKKFLIAITGRHPFFLQAAAYALWNAYENNRRPKLPYVGEQCYKAADPALHDTWGHWSPEMRKVLVIIALDEIPHLLGGREFDLSKLRDSLPSYNNEVKKLAQNGFIMRGLKLKTGWKILPQVLLWWLTGILLAAIRENNDLGGFLKEHEMNGLFSQSEKVQFTKAVVGLGNLAKLGIESFVKAASEGLAKGFSK